MRIVSSDIALSSSSININSRNVQERLRAWDKNSELTYSAEKTDASIAESSVSIKDLVTISPEAAAVAKNTPATTGNGNDSSGNPYKEFMGDLKARIIKDIVEMMTGKKIKVFDPGEIDTTEQSMPPPETVPSSAGSGNTAPQRKGWGIDYYYKESSYTREGISFSATGSVATADGRNIKFTASLEMSRETWNQVELSVKAGDALIDPLVIDLAGNGTRFSDVKFAFDLDRDGKDESINAPAAGTGFLAIDRNGNGTIDDGTELFGPQSGNGFDELARLDDDGNGWIDENDAAFTMLRIWQKGINGTGDSLGSLLDNNVGAIYTGRAPTDYALTDSANNLAGTLRESGIYLKESGGVGVVQEVDLVA